MSWIRYRHISRLLIVTSTGFVLGLAALVAARPKTFGKYGHYRAAALEENRTREPRYAGKADCVGCHSDMGDQLAQNRHQNLSCEVCHGPMAVHSGDAKKENASVPKDDLFCLHCHEKSAARPAFMPQIVLADHGGEKCRDCHAPHTPKS